MSAQAQTHAQLTSANLDQQNRQLADLTLADDASAPAPNAPNTPNDAAAPPALVDSPTSEHAPLPATPRADVDAPVGQRSESYVERNNHQKKRKYSAELYQFHKGAWAAVRDDIEKRKAAGEHIPSHSSSTDSELTKSPF